MDQVEHAARAWHRRSRGGGLVLASAGDHGATPVRSSAVEQAAGLGEVVGDRGPEQRAERRGDGRLAAFLHTEIRRQRPGAARRRRGAREELVDCGKLRAGLGRPAAGGLHLALGFHAGTARRLGGALGGLDLGAAGFQRGLELLPAALCRGALGHQVLQLALDGGRLRGVDPRKLLLERRRPLACGRVAGGLALLRLERLALARQPRGGL